MSAPTLDRSRPFGTVFIDGRQSGFAQDGHVFDQDGREVVTPPADPTPAPKKRGRPRKQPAGNE